MIFVIQLKLGYLHRTEGPLIWSKILDCESSAFAGQSCHPIGNEVDLTPTSWKEHLVFYKSFGNA